VCGLRTGKKNRLVKPKQNGEPTGAEAERDPLPETATERDDRADGDQPRVAKRPPGRLPTR